MANPIGRIAPKKRMAMTTGLTTRYINSPSFSHARLARPKDCGRQSVSPAKTTAMPKPDRRVGRTLVQSKDADQSKDCSHRGPETAVARSDHDFVMFQFQ
jgi:hypothetical protein